MSNKNNNNNKLSSSISCFKLISKVLYHIISLIWMPLKVKLLCKTQTACCLLFDRTLLRNWHFQWLLILHFYTFFHSITFYSSSLLFLSRYIHRLNMNFIDGKLWKCGKNCRQYLPFCWLLQPQFLFNSICLCEIFTFFGLTTQQKQNETSKKN